MNPSRPTALVLEDERRYRDFLAEVLRGMEYEPVLAGQAAEAMRVAAAGPPDLLMLDLNLPLKDGLTFLEEFREHCPDTPVIIITGFGDLESARRAIRLGVSDFLTKPCDLGQIEQAIGRARTRAGTPEMVVSIAAPDAEITVLPLAALEREAIVEALRRTGGNRSEAARQLGISRRAIYNKIAEYRGEGREIP